MAAEQKTNAMRLVEQAGIGYKLSLRAVPPVNAAQIAANFGGGGHPGAGGATTRLSLEETAKLLEEYMLEA